MGGVSEVVASKVPRGVSLDLLVFPAEAGDANGEGVPAIGFGLVGVQEDPDRSVDGVGFPVRGVEVEEDEGVEAVLPVLPEGGEDGVGGGPSRGGGG